MTARPQSVEHRVSSVESEGPKNVRVLVYAVGADGHHERVEVDDKVAW